MSSSLATPPISTTVETPLDPMIEFSYRHLRTTRNICLSGTGAGGSTVFYDRDTGNEICADQAHHFAQSTLSVDAYKFYPALISALTVPGAGTFVTTSGVSVSSTWLTEVASLIAAGERDELLDLVLGNSRPDSADLHVSLTACADMTVILTWDSRALDVRRFMFLRPSTALGERSVPPSHPHSVVQGRGVFATHDPVDTLTV